MEAPDEDGGHGTAGAAHRAPVKRRGSNLPRAGSASASKECASGCAGEAAGVMQNGVVRIWQPHAWPQACPAPAPRLPRACPMPAPRLGSAPLHTPPARAPAPLPAPSPPDRSARRPVSPSLPPPMQASEGHARRMCMGEALPFGAIVTLLRARFFVDPEAAPAEHAHAHAHCDTHAHTRTCTRAHARRRKPAGLPPCLPHPSDRLLLKKPISCERALHAELRSNTRARPDRRRVKWGILGRG